MKKKERMKEWELELFEDSKTFLAISGVKILWKFTLSNSLERIKTLKRFVCMPAKESCLKYVFYIFSKNIFHYKCFPAMNLYFTCSENLKPAGELYFEKPF